MGFDFFKKLFASPQKEEPVKAPSKSNKKVETHRVAGTNHRVKDIASMGLTNGEYLLNKKDLIKRKLFDKCIYQYVFKPSKIELIEEPENPHDSNAIKVLIDGTHVGYIKRGSCSHVKKLLKSNAIEKITAEIKGGKYKCLYDHGCDYELETGNDTYTIKLSIHCNIAEE